MLDLAAIMESNGLSFQSHKVDGNPYMPQDSSDMRHWLCTVSGGHLPEFEFYVSLGDENDEEPNAAFALSLVLEDVRAYRTCVGYPDFARLLGVEDDDPAGRLAWEEVGRLAPLAESFAELSPSPVSAPS